jgi:signal transduction histidine kinase
VATFILGVAVLYATHVAFSRQIDTNIDQASDALLIEYRGDGLDGVLEAISQQRGPGPISLGTALFAPDGRRMAGNLVARMPAPGWQQITFMDPREGPDRARARTFVLRGGYRLVVAADLEALESIDRTIFEMFAVAFAALMILGVVGAFGLALYLRKRLQRIETTAGAIIAGDLSQRAFVGEADDEFDRVAVSLNAMLDRIAALVANLRQVSSDLAHDLRTPLARLRNQLEAMRQDRSDADRGELLGLAIEQTDEVLSLFEAILRISELEEGALQRAFSLLDLSALIAEIGDLHLAMAEDCDHAMVVSVAPELKVHGDRELIAQAVINLIENALRHTPAGSTIELAAGHEGDRTTIVVRDNGPGISEAERGQVLQRFTRLEAARSTPGHGLGLSLVAAIAGLHRAELALEDAGPGLLVRLSFGNSAA